MRRTLRLPAFAMAAALVLVAAWPGSARAGEARGLEVLDTWYRLTLALVRHTPTYSPPVASRTFAYLGVTAFEVAAAGRGDLVSLAGQLNGLDAPPVHEPELAYDEAVALHAALEHVVRELFSNTGPTGQRAMDTIAERVAAASRRSVDEETAERSAGFGRALARHMLAWSRGDGGAVVENMGFPQDYELEEGPEHWVPTSTAGQQQVPLLPSWGDNRTFAMPDGATCQLPPPPAYSESEDSRFYEEAYEVYEVSKSLSEEEKAIANFWSDDPMLTPTPPGHWLSIAMQVLDETDAGLDKRVETLARLGVGLADAFIGCWYDKFVYDLVRPVTYIRRRIDPDWQTMLASPPFPEYPSGHSTQSGAAAEILTRLFGEEFAFEDATHAGDGIKARRFASFWEAAEEAGISRLYGGIHYRAAIELGLDQGRCIAEHTNALETRR